MPDCWNCKSYRAETWAYEKILKEIRAHSFAVEAINAVRSLEEKSFEQESYLKIHGLGLEQDGWPATPKISPYCNLETPDGHHFIAEIKNAGHRCDDYELGQPQGGGCGSCRYAVSVDGWRNDAQAVGFAAMLQRSSDVINRATSSVAFEIQAAHVADGLLPTKPQYLTYCGKLSRQDQYVVCSIHNTKSDCLHWTTRRSPIRGSFNDP